MNSSTDFYPNTWVAIDEKEIVYIDARSQFLARIDQKSYRGIIALMMLNLLKVTSIHSDIQWKYGQLRRAEDFYDMRLEITDSSPEELPIWTPSEIEKLAQAMERAYSKTAH